MKKLTRVLILLVLVLAFSLTFGKKALAADSYWSFVLMKQSDGKTYEITRNSYKQDIYIEDGQEHSQYIGYSNKYTRLKDHSLVITLDDKTRTYTCRVKSGSMESSDESGFLDGEFYAYYLNGTKVSNDTVWTYALSPYDHLGSFFWVQGNVIESPTVKISSPDITVPYTHGCSSIDLPDAKIESSTNDGVNIKDIHPYVNISSDDIGKGSITKQIKCDKGIKVTNDSYVNVTVTAEDLTQARLFNVPENAQYTYTGSEICPLLGDVYIDLSGGYEIHPKEGVDYDITYEDNILPTSKAKIILTFKGRYTGTKTYNFTICPMELTEKDVTISVEDFVEGKGYANLASLMPTFSNRFQSLRDKDPNNGNISVKLSTKDEEGNDKFLSEATTPGEYLCKVTIDDGTYYKGITVNKKFKILAKPAPAQDSTPAPSDQDSAPNTQEVVTQPDTKATTNTTTNNATTTSSTKTKKKKATTSVTTSEAETVATEEVAVSENEVTVAEVTEEAAVIEEAPTIEEAVKEETTVKEAVSEEKDETVIADEDVALVNALTNSKLPLSIIIIIVLGSLIAFSGIGFGIYKYLGKSGNN